MAGEEGGERLIERTVAVAERGGDQRWRRGEVAGWGPGADRGGEARVHIHGPQQQDIVRINHHRVGFGAVFFPHRSVVEAAESLSPGLHVWESAEPHETVGVVQVAELAHQRHAGGLLRFDELTFEQADQVVAPARVESVLPEFDNGVPNAGHPWLPSASQLLSAGAALPGPPAVSVAVTPAAFRAVRRRLTCRPVLPAGPARRRGTGRAGQAGCLCP